MRYSCKLGSFGFIVAAIAIAGCGGANQSATTGGQSSVMSKNTISGGAIPLVAPTLTPPPDNGATLSTMHEYTTPKGTYHPAVINGLDMQFTPPVADSPTGGHGPSLSKLDGVRCQPHMSNNYHAHAFVGLYINGVEYAMPRGIGVVEPTDPSQLSIYTATECFYYTHTHDSTGIVHLEDFNNGVVENPPVSTNFTSGQLFTIWGITVNQMQFGQFSGPLEVFTSGQQYVPLDEKTGGTIAESQLTQWTGDPAQIPLYGHEVIWYLVGPNYPASLPSVHFSPGQ
ncbi:MAG: hypothetical protein M3R51_05750 [Candidatus Eremiobacteraeota bacterium]|nr:hypothetical protein [Candidatus Eremiobacteraeota bacterium]